MIRVFDPGPDPDLLPIPDPRVKKAPDPGSWIRIRNTVLNQIYLGECIDSFIGSVSFKANIFKNKNGQDGLYYVKVDGQKSPCLDEISAEVLRLALGGAEANSGGGGRPLSHLQPGQTLHGQAAHIANL
jgi:hypothetical protein